MPDGLLFLVSDDYSKRLNLTAGDLWQPDVQMLNSFGAGLTKVALVGFFSCCRVSALDGKITGLAAVTFALI
jgi:hypothetical protein